MPMDNSGEFIKDAGTMRNLAGPFAYGAGQLNPARASSPGLVFDATPEDYMTLLCSLGYTPKNISVLAGTKYNCTKCSPHVDFNYPTIHIYNPMRNASKQITRTMKNVGHAVSIYHARIKSPFGVSLKVTPSTLNFSHLDQKLDFVVTMKQKGPDQEYQLDGWSSGAITWIDPQHGYVVNVVILISWTT